MEENLIMRLQYYLTEIATVTDKVVPISRNMISECKDMSQKHFVFLVEDFHNIDSAGFTNKVIHYYLHYIHLNL